ncbi:hypothetical protein A0U90_10815 [Kozakia baliensis]|nr:hypothetical protein A0U90_10815 [Kozakia baliensis]
MQRSAHDPVSQTDDSDADALLHAAESYRSSARLNAIRADRLQEELKIMRRQTRLMRNSLSWRITLPLRVIRSLSLGKSPKGAPLSEVKERIKDIARENGLRVLALRISAAILRRLGIKTHRLAFGARHAEEDPLFSCSQEAETFYTRPVARSVTTLSPRFLIIADLNIKQCVKYRVQQKKELLTSLGWEVCIIDRQDTARAMSEIQVATQVIFYRVPGDDDALQLVREAHRLNLSPRWEVDDLIFDRSEYLKNTNIHVLKKKEQRGLLDGADLFRLCLLECGRGLASTAKLAQAMKNIGISDVAVVENALDGETLAVAKSLPQLSFREKEAIYICYGSGSRAHDVDFKEVQSGLIAAMKAEPRLRLRIIGSLTLSNAFESLQERIETISELSYAEYLSVLADSDIAIAPLEDTLFNDCKSNIKFLEASIVGVASVCSPANAFENVVRDGENGFLASSASVWQERLLALAQDVSLRHALATAARRDVLELYMPEKIARNQLFPLYGAPSAFTPEKMRILMANVFFAPRSFGGATIVAEAMVKPLQERQCEVSVLTCRPDLDQKPSGNIRYVACGADVLSVLPGRGASVDNPTIADDLARWADAWRPDLVHFHAIQEMGTAMLRLCQARQVPYVITLHDCWWLSDQLFLTKDDGSYHLDKKIHPKRSTYEHYLQARRAVARQGILGAAALLSPSEEHKRLYVNNGVPAERIFINRNGFCWPARPRRPREPGSLVRFAFVGGVGHIKGYELIQECMASLTQNNWELVLVDNTLNLGFPSIDPNELRVRGKVTVVPAYSQSGLDEFYDKVDVLLFPSQWRESYGLSVREALSRDVWVISTAPGGQSEEIVEGVNGNLIPITDKVGPLKKAVEALLQNPARFDRYTNPLKDRLPTYDRQADELVTLYKKILGR